MSWSIDTRMQKSIKHLQKEYVSLMGPEAVGLYYRIMWLMSQSLSSPVTVKYVLDRTLNIHHDSTISLLKKLKAFGLITTKTIVTSEGNEQELEWHLPKRLSKQEKMDAVTKMLKYFVISVPESEVLFDHVSKLEETELTEQEAVEAIEKTSQDEDFENLKKKIGDDTGMGLVIFYYQTLGKEFGGRYVSRNLQIEAANLNTVMKKNGDTAEKTREYFKWIIKKNKRENKFDRVSGLGLYPELRKEAHYAIDVQKKGDKKFEEVVEDISKEDKMMNNMKGVYEIYVQKGMTPEDALQKMRQNFAEEAVNKFLGTLNVQ